MNGRKILAFLVLLLALASCAVQSKSNEYVFQNEPVLFPELFEGISWSYDEQLLRTKFPKSTIENVEYGDSLIATILTGIEFPYFGQASIDIVHDSKGSVLFYTIDTDELRITQCSPENEKRPNNCRNRYNRELIQIRNDVLRYIQNKYGKGSATKSCDWDYETSPRKEICVDNYAWSLEKNREMSLGIYKGEDGWWEVQFMIKKISGHP